MPSRSRQRRPEPHDIAAEIIRRVTANTQTGGGYVVRLSKPPTPTERLQLIAARLERRPIVIMPHKCATFDQWLEQYALQGAKATAGR
jgi:hypothetical protein